MRRASDFSLRSAKTTTHLHASITSIVHNDIKKYHCVDNYLLVLGRLEGTELSPCSSNHRMEDCLGCIEHLMTIDEKPFAVGLDLRRPFSLAYHNKGLTIFSIESFTLSNLDSSSVE
jgi:hypothetical protein